MGGKGRLVKRKKNINKNSKILEINTLKIKQKVNKCRIQQYLTLILIILIMDRHYVYYNKGHHFYLNESYGLNNVSECGKTFYKIKQNRI